MKRRRWSRTLAVVAVGLTPLCGWAEEREHFQLKLSPSYEEGNFGTSRTTTIVFVPLTLKYLGERFDLGVTASFAHIDTSGGVTIVEGTPTRTGAGTATSASGVGDTILKARWFLFDDPGLNSPLPGLTPFAKIKIPTADRDKNLGTGEPDYGFGVEFDKRIHSFFILGDASYTVIGSPPGQDFRNRPAVSLGVGARLSDTVTVTVLGEWRRALVNTGEDPADLLGILTYKLTRTMSISPNILVGLTNGAPAWGVGVELGYRFGRY